MKNIQAGQIMKQAQAFSGFTQDYWSQVRERHV